MDRVLEDKGKGRWHGGGKDAWSKKSKGNGKNEKGGFSKGGGKGKTSWGEDFGVKIRTARKVERAKLKTTRAKVRVVRGLIKVLSDGRKRVLDTYVVAWNMLLLNVGNVVQIKFLPMMEPLQPLERLQLCLRQLHSAVTQFVPAPSHLR